MKNPIAFVSIICALTANASSVEWRFGSAPGRDGDGGFQLSNTSATNGEWSVEAGSLRFRNAYVSEDADGNNFTEAAAVVDLRDHGWEPGRDFTLSLEFDIEGVADWNRLGIIALAPEMGGHEYNGRGFYHGQLRVQSGGVTHLRVSDGFGGDRPMVSIPMPDTIENGAYRLQLSGAYDDRGALILRVEGEKAGSGEMLVTQAPAIGAPLENGWFGFGGRIKSYAGARQPVIDFKRFRFEPKAAELPEIDADPIRVKGLWTHEGREHPFVATVRKSTHKYSPLPAAVYLRNLAIPRIGTDSDEAIVEDLLDDGLVVVELDCRDIPSGSPAMERALLNFHQQLPHLVSSASSGIVQVDEYYLYTLPSGYRLERNVPFWNIEKHGAHGTLDGVLKVYNTTVAKRFGVEPVDSIEDMRGSGGERFDYNLYMDIVYPSGDAEMPVPTIAHFATICRMSGTFVAGERRLFPIGWVTSGYALVLVDHIYHPAARVRYYGHFNPNFSLDVGNGVAAGSAAMRFLRAHAGDYNLNGRIGALGHSKSSYSVMRLADPNHHELGEYKTFDGYPEGSPEEQPWEGYDSHIDVAYASMGLGIRRVQYTTADLVPLVVATGRHDHFDYWNVTPEQVATAERLDLNHLAIWMEELGHTFPFGYDRPTGQDRTLLVRRYFDQHLEPRGDDRLIVLSVMPANNAEEVGLDGSSRLFPVDKEDLPKDLHGLSATTPITVRFARSIALDSVRNDALSVRETASSERVDGRWSPSLQNSRFTFTPEQPLSANTEYTVVVSAGIADNRGRSLEREHRSTFRTRH